MNCIGADFLEGDFVEESPVEDFVEVQCVEADCAKYATESTIIIDFAV